MTPYAVAPLASLPTAPLRCLLFPSSPCVPHLLPTRPHSNRTPSPFLSAAPRRCPPFAASAVDSPTPFPSNQTSRFQQWDSMTAKFAGASNVPFLLIQLPQILLNSRNLLAGNKAALFAVPWLCDKPWQGMLTGLLGNLTLLSYFAKKKETEAIVVQTLGVVSIYVVIAQLAIAGAVPLPHFTAISAVVASGLVLNFMNYFNWIGEGVWLLWEDFTTIIGLSVLPQASCGGVMWSTFVPFIPNSILPGTISCIMAVAVVVTAIKSSNDIANGPAPIRQSV
ncbi:putative Maltose excess protein 1-like, chloroplastic [Cocos nucifera]|nr:putative Maltose excess protein 1-like, chloroplastic [Cocos nucifera]